MKKFIIKVDEKIIKDCDELDDAIDLAKDEAFRLSEGNIDKVIEYADGKNFEVNGIHISIKKLR